MLPLAAALAIVLLIFAAVSVPGWYERDKEGFTDPAIAADLVGLLTALIVPLQLLLIAFAMRGFQQAWNVEVEQPADGGRRGDTPRPGLAARVPVRNVADMSRSPWPRSTPSANRSAIASSSGTSRSWRSATAAISRRSLAAWRSGNAGRN